MSNQTEAELKVVAVITLNRILELTPNDPTHCIYPKET